MLVAPNIVEFEPKGRGKSRGQNRGDQTWA
jgi:hypothetical protein